MKKLILHTLLLLLPLQLLAFVEVRNGHFYWEGSKWRALGVNISPSVSNKESFQAVSQFGCNSVRVAPTSVQQLRDMVKWAKRAKVKLYVMLNDKLLPETLKTFQNKREIWAWEVSSEAIAKRMKAVCPHHLVSLSSDAQHTNLQAYADVVTFSPYIDFLSIPLRPIESKWVAPSNLYLGLRNAYLKTEQLIQTLARRMHSHAKPILISACSYPRDKMFRLPESSTSLRDSYFSFVMNFVLPNQGIAIAGVYFQSWEMPPAEVDDDSHLTTYSIYPSDSTTRQVISQ